VEVGHRGEEKTTAPDQTAHQTGLITSVPSGIEGGGSPTHWPTAAVSSNHYVSKQFVSSQIGVGWDPPREELVSPAVIKELVDLRVF
jgi:hypothetical protein